MKRMPGDSFHERIAGRLDYANRPRTLIKITGNWPNITCR